MTDSDLVSDIVQPFQIEDMNVRGRLVRLGPAVRHILDNHNYPAPVAGLLAETLALTAALATSLKFDGIFTLQTQSDGAVPLMVADVTSAGDMRGFARIDEEKIKDAETGDGALMPRYLGSGHIAFTVDQGPDTERYQGITALEGESLTDCAQAYFKQSEQLDTTIVLAENGENAAALMIQRMPGENKVEGKSEEDEDNWRRAVAFAASTTREELLNPRLKPAELLYRLYHEDGVRLYETKPVQAQCRCSKAKVEGSLRTIPRAELEAMADDGKVSITCEFCKTDYTFDGNDFDRLCAG